MSIESLAYRLWEARGRQEGLADEDWLAAERQLVLEETSSKTGDPKPQNGDTGRFKAIGTNVSGEVTLIKAGRTYGAIYSVARGMLHLKTHTETRSLELGEQEAVELARKTLEEIVDAQER